MSSLRRKIFDLVSRDNPQRHLRSRIYDYFQLSCIILSVLPLAFRDYTPGLRALEYFCVVAFIIDYIIRWITADYKLNRGSWSFVIYPFTPMAIIDMLSILPTFNVLNNAFHLARVTRLLKIVRLFKFGRYSQELSIFIQVLKKQGSVLISVLVMAIFYIVLTALLMFTVDSQFEDFFDAIYWATSALTTVGYGDVYPHNDVGKVVSMISSLVGVAIIALPSGVITASYLETIASMRADKKNKSAEPIQGEEKGQ